MAAHQLLPGRGNVFMKCQNFVSKRSVATVQARGFSTKPCFWHCQSFCPPGSCKGIIIVDSGNRKSAWIRIRAFSTTTSAVESFPVDSRHRAHPAVTLPSLGADEFRHPLDRQNTALLRAIPGLNDIGRLLLGPVAEQMMMLENMGTAILVGPTQLSKLHALMVEAASILGMPPPDLYVRQSPLPNAYTLAMSGKRPFVVVHTALVELLTPAELQAVLAHELGHLKCDHGIWLTLANVMALGAYSVPGLGALLARNMEDQLMRWLRAAELTCDRAALLVAQDSKVVVSLLMKLAGGSPSLAADLNVDAFLQQARSYDEAASSSPLSWYLRNAQTRQLSHPLPVLRAREIDQFARSREYKAILERGRLDASRRERGLGSAK